MDIIRGLHNLQRQHSTGCAATIGAFDGIHCGHQKILTHISVVGQQMQIPSLVITMEPLPREWLHPHDPPPRLMSLRDKLTTIARFKIQHILIIHFNTHFASITAEDFVRRYLADALGVRYLMVGSNWRFGHQRAGDYTLLQKMADQYGFTVAPAETVHLDGQRISSTRIRQTLCAGDFSLAARLLGRPYQITGLVGRGRGKGEELQAPTINLSVPRNCPPLAGVYIVEVAGVIPSQYLRGVANVGTNPTMVREGVPQLEVHLLDFKGNLYGKRVEVLFRQRIRPEKRFQTVKQLKYQIKRDIQDAQNFFDHWQDK